MRLINPNGLGECLTSGTYLPGTIEAVFNVSGSECWAVRLDKSIIWADDMKRNRIRDLLVRIVAHVNQLVVVQKCPEARAGEELVEIQVFACRDEKIVRMVKSFDESTFVSGGFAIVEPLLEKSRDILHRRIRIRFSDPDGLGECLTTTEYLRGWIDGRLEIAGGENWILVLDKAVAWPDYAGQLQRTQKFLVRVDYYVTENDALQKFREAGLGEWVALVHILAPPATQSPEQISSEDECQYVSGGTLIIEAKATP